MNDRIQLTAIVVLGVISVVATAGAVYLMGLGGDAAKAATAMVTIAAGATGSIGGALALRPRNEGDPQVVLQQPQLLGPKPSDRAAQ